MGSILEEQAQKIADERHSRIIWMCWMVVAVAIVVVLVAAALIAPGAALTTDEFAAEWQTQTTATDAAAIAASNAADVNVSAANTSAALTSDFDLTDTTLGNYSDGVAISTQEGAGNHYKISVSSNIPADRYYSDLPTIDEPLIKMLTGETAYVIVKLDDVVGGTTDPLRFYFQFDKGSNIISSDNKFCGSYDFDTEITFVADSGLKVPCVFHKVSDTLCYMQVNGGDSYIDTLQIYLPVKFVNGSAGGDMYVWPDVSGGTSAPQEALGFEWDTISNNFNVYEEFSDYDNLAFNTVDDKVYICPTTFLSTGAGSEFLIQWKLDKVNENCEGSSGKGANLYKDVAFTHSLTLPDDVSVRSDVAQALANGNAITVSVDSGSAYIKIKLDDGKDYMLAMIYDYTWDSGTTIGTDAKVSIEGDKFNISWTLCNTKLSNDEIVEMPTTNQAVYYNTDLFLVDINTISDLADANNGKATFVFKGETKAEGHLEFGGLYTGEASKDRIIETEALISATKTKSTGSTTYMGQAITFYIDFTNKGVLPYPGLSKVTDPLTLYYYIEPKNMQNMFDNVDRGKALTIEINNAKLCTIADQAAADTSGKECSVSRDMASDDTRYYDLDSVFVSSDRCYEEKNVDFKFYWASDGSCLEVLMTHADGTQQAYKIGEGAATGGVDASSAEGASAPEDASTPEDANSTEAATDFATIEDFFNAVGYVVDSRVRYTCTWNEDPVQIDAGQSRLYVVSANLKTTFMLLDSDKQHSYTGNPTTTSSVGRYVTNDAYYWTKGAEERAVSTGTASITKSYLYNEVDIDATGSSSGTTLGEAAELQDGAVVTYTNSLTRKNSVYDTTPMVDRVSSGQVLLVPASLNQNLADLGLSTKSVNNTDYYVLDKPGEYHNVYVGNHLADTVDITQDSSGLTSLIKWYFTTIDSSSTDNVSFMVMIDSSTFGSDVADIQAKIKNEVWVGDREGHRIYDYTEGTVRSYSIDKNTVTNAQDGIDSSHDYAQDELASFSYIHEGNSVTYRLTLSTRGSSKVNFLGGMSSIYDSLPSALNNYWVKNKTVHLAYVVPEGSSVEFSDGAGDCWDISTDASKGTSQKLYWTSGSSMTVKGILYIYVTLDFPSGEGWDSYADSYGAVDLYNTWTVYGLSDSVSHLLALKTEGVLQKSVVSTGEAARSGSFYSYQVKDDADSCWYYSNNSAASTYGAITYSLTLYNGGKSRMYLTEIEDILPQGFTFAGFYLSPTYFRKVTGTSYRTSGFNDKSSSAYKSTLYYQTMSQVNDPNRSVTYKGLGFSVECNQSNSQAVTFNFSKGGTSTRSVAYDESRGMYYLKPGEAVVIAYNCYTNNYSDTLDAAENSAAFRFYDYCGEGVEVDDDVEISVGSNYVPEGKTQNCGDCEIASTANIAMKGMLTKNGSTDTQWLTSSATVYRGAVVPGIQKTCSKEAAVATEDLDWTIKNYNTGTDGLRDYVITDKMMSPYAFTGEVSYVVRASDSSKATVEKLFTISREVSIEGTTKLSLKASNNKTYTTTLGGEGVIVPDATYGDIEVTFAISDDGDEMMSLYFMDQAKATIPYGGYSELSVTTKNQTNVNENKTFVNEAYLTPLSQTFVKSAVEKGRYTDFDVICDESDEFLPSVKSQAQVMVFYGYATTSSLEVTELDDSLALTNNKAASNSEDTSIVLNGPSSMFRYKLNVVNSGYDGVSVGLTDFVAVDNLPQLNDHTTMYEKYDRSSEFEVDFASLEDLNLQVKVTEQSGETHVLEPGQYTVLFSSQTSLDYETSGNKSIWDDSSAGALSASDGWYTLEELASGEVIGSDGGDGGALGISDMRSIRVAINDPNCANNLIPPKSTVSIEFNAVIDGEALYSQTAWNSFAYLYGTSAGKLRAAPTSVGVKVPSVPYLSKSLVKYDGSAYAAPEDRDFSFVIYDGAPITLDAEGSADDAFDMLDAVGREATLVSVGVKAGQSASDVIALDNLKVYKKVDGAWAPSDEDWTWKTGAQYSVMELIKSKQADYEFGSINLRANPYTFIFDQTSYTEIAAVNKQATWNISLIKQAAEGGQMLSDAWFGIYSPDEGDQMSEAAIAESGIDSGSGLGVKRQVEYDGALYYLMDIQKTDASGNASWKGLTGDKYYVMELKAPSGYAGEAEARRLVEADFGDTQELLMYNYVTYQMPMSGGIDYKALATAGAVLMLLAIAFATRKQTRRQK